MKKILFILVAFLCFILQLPSNSFVLNADEAQENVMIYKLVESDEDLVLHKKIVIVDETLSFAMIKNDTRSNFDSTAILNFKENNVSYIKITNSVQTFKLGVGAIENTYSLHNDLGYLTSTDYIMNVEEKSSWDILFNETATLSNHYYTNGLFFDKEDLQFTSISNKNYISSRIYIECDLDEINKITVVNDLNAEILSLKDADELAQRAKESYTEEKYLVQGTIISINNYEYGNLTIKDPFNNTLNIYGVWGDKGNTRYDSIPVEAKPSIGDNVILYGVLGTHRNISEMKSSWLITYQAHEHSYENKYDDDYHYQECIICEYATEKEEHIYNHIVNEPTCYVEGNTLYYCECGKNYTTNYVAAKNHPNYIVSYKWGKDHLSCQAIINCLDCLSEFTVNSRITKNIISGQCESEAVIEYSATFPPYDHYIFETQKYEETVNVLQHNFRLESFSWSEDHTKCTLHIVCQINKEHKKEIEVQSTISEVKSTCEYEGRITYRAINEQYNFYQNFVVILPKIEHEIVTKNTGYFPGTFRVRLEHSCINCSYSKTEYVDMFTYFTSKNGEGCKGSTSTFITLISILGLLILNKHK